MKNIISLLIPKIIKVSPSSKVREIYSIKKLKSKFGKSNVSANDIQIEVWLGDTWAILQDGIQKPFEGRFLAMINSSLEKEGMSKLGVKKSGHVYYDPVREQYTIVNCSGKVVFIGSGKNIDEISRIFRRIELHKK
ncbi:hypothetical protein [Ilyobacter sp.]|uniref:hypothetical protein n=1 Tax=Ilyobacter sp. TaxID=3100343 RepID=UPI003564ED71